MMFDRNHAEVMRTRLLDGLSWIDADGNERSIERRPGETDAQLKRRIKPPRDFSTVPSVDQLLARYSGEHPDTSTGDLGARLTEIIGRQRDMRAKPIGEGGADLASRFAKLAGMTLDEALAADTGGRRAAVDPRHAPFVGSEVPPLFRDAIVRGPISDTQAVRTVRAWRKAGTWAIALGGSTGTGKTFAAVVGLFEADGGRFVRAESIAAPDGRDLAETCSRTPFLVLDDMGDEVLTDLGTRRLRDVLTARHQDALPTAITSNLSAPAWLDRYGRRLMDRLMDGAGYVEIGGASMRGTK